jgi:hypothetical protein
MFFFSPGCILCGSPAACPVECDADSTGAAHIGTSRRMFPPALFFRQSRSSDFLRCGPKSRLDHLSKRRYWDITETHYHQTG